jgi:hypothetical protein
MVRPRFRSLAILGSVLSVVAACTSSTEGGDATTQPPVTANARNATEVARQEIGAAGGSVSGAGATIDIPPGALAANTTIVIKTLTPTSVMLPTSSAIAGTAYTFEPDDVQFGKPVTVTVAVDASKVGAVTGAIVLLRAVAASNHWEPRGAAEIGDTKVQAATDHFSDWVPTITQGVSCFAKAACAADASAGGPVGIDCHIPIDGPGVHCYGSQSPYTCTCAGSSQVLLTLASPPSVSVLNALASACGATCPSTDPITDGGAAPDAGGAVCPIIGADGSPSACEMVSPTCADGHQYAVRCQTASGQCSCQMDGSQTKMVTGGCGNGWDLCGFPLRGNITSSPSDSGTPPEDSGSVSDASVSLPDAGSAVSCPPVGADADPASCEMISPPCTDGHVYSVHCTTASGMCMCGIDGNSTNSLTADCGSAWDKCGFPVRRATN